MPSIPVLNTSVLYTDNSVYSACISSHAYSWMRDYQNLNSVEYLESCAGPVLSYYIAKYGPVKVLTDLDIKIQAQLR